MTTTTRYIIYGQVYFLGLLLVCLLLSPHYLFESNEGGISNFGIHTKTIIPYSLAFGLAAICTYKAAQSLNRKYNRRHTLRYFLLILSALYAATLLSTYPYIVNSSFNALHQLTGAAMVVYALFLGGWLLKSVRINQITVIAYLIQVAGFMLAVCNYFDIVHVLFVAEALSAIGFGAVLIRTMRVTDNSNK